MTELEASQQKEIERLRGENRLLREKLDIVIRQIFGKKSERLDPAQLELLLGEHAGEEPPGKPEASSDDEGQLLEADNPNKKRGKKERRPRLPENLPIIETVIDPDPVRASPEAWRRIGEEVSELLDYQPGKFRRLRTVRPKYVRVADRDKPPLIAPLPAKLIDGGIAAPGLITQIIISKYCDHLPLYRQEKIFGQRHDVHLPRQTMCNWVEQAANWLRPIYREMHKQLFRSSYIGADETPIKYLAPGHGKAKQGYLWTYRNPAEKGGGDVLYDWHPGRGHGCLKSFIPEDYSGVIQCDAYAAYQTYARDHPHEITLAGCWAHARRKIHDAYQTATPGTIARQRAAWLLRQIQGLYQIEGRLKKSRASPAQKQAARQSQSHPITGRIHRALTKLKASQHDRVLPKSQLGKAIDYALKQWAPLTVFIGDGRIEIDNNQVENAIRPTAIGKKNWLFIGSEEAGWRSAVIYSIIESCRTRGIDPSAYLRDVLTRLPDATNWEIPGLTPAAWAEAKKRPASLSEAS